MSKKLKSFEINSELKKDEEEENDDEKKKNQYYSIKFKYCARFFAYYYIHDWYDGKDVTYYYKLMQSSLNVSSKNSYFNTYS